MRINLILLIIILPNIVNCQTLYYKMDNYCFPFSYVEIQNSKLDSIKSDNDSTHVYFTWIYNCAFIPKFTLSKYENDTLHIKLNNLDDTYAGCDCEFHIRLDFKRLKSNFFYFMINDSIVRSDLKRYKLNAIQEIYYPEFKLKREIYFKEDKIVVECFYDKNGKLIKERFYNDFTGHFRYENEY